MLFVFFWCKQIYSEDSVDLVDVLGVISDGEIYSLRV